jgi:hypothetical protein
VDRFGFTEKKIYTLAVAGKIDAVRVGKRWMISESELSDLSRKTFGSNGVL